MTIKDSIQKISSLSKGIVFYCFKHYLQIIVCLLFLFLGLPIVLTGNIPLTTDQRDFYFVRNEGHLKTDLDFNGKKEDLRIDIFNFWGGNSGQMVAILENDKSEMLGCWHLAEYRAYINSLKSQDNELYIDIVTHQKDDVMASPSKRVVYQFYYDYYNKVLVFDNDLDFDFSDTGIHIKPEPCDWNFRFYLAKKGFQILDIKSYFKFFNLVFSKFQEEQYYNYYRIKAGYESEK